MRIYHKLSYDFYVFYKPISFRRFNYIALKRSTYLRDYNYYCDKIKKYNVKKNKSSVKKST